MRNNVAVVLCCHHKPWLIMSTLITLAVQDYQDYDIFVLFQEGDGKCLDKPSYREYFHLAEKHGVNIQLSPHDRRVRDIVRQVSGKNVQEIFLENDHALDSGAWYKFIRTRKWEEYDYIFMIQEGTLLTRDNVLSSSLGFVRERGIHFLSAGHEKRKMSKNHFLNYNTQGEHSSEFDLYHDEQIKKVFQMFCRDPEFKEIFLSWRPDCPLTTQNHVPDVFVPWRMKCYQILQTVKHFGEISAFGPAIHEDTYRRSLKNIVRDFSVWDNIIFHKDNAPEWFGCSCQHLFSREFLEKFSAKLENYDIYDVLDIPFAGTPLEPIWGFLPQWLGYDKWFFDGIHRIRKNFVTYAREDDPAGMCRYIHAYYRDRIRLKVEGDYLRIGTLHKKYCHARHMLGAHFWSDVEHNGKSKVEGAKNYWRNLAIPARNASLIFDAVQKYYARPLHRVLEFGCGGGGNLKYFMDKIPGLNTWGIDVNSRVNELREQYPNFTGIVGDEKSLALFDRNEFDVAFTISVLDHIPSDFLVKQAITDLTRVARFVILLEPYIEGVHGDVSDKKRGQVKKGLIRPDKKFAKHSYIWNYDDMLKSIGVTYIKYPMSLHVSSLGPFYYLYVIEAFSLGEEGPTRDSHLTDAIGATNLEESN